VLPNSVASVPPSGSAPGAPRPRGRHRRRRRSPAGKGAPAHEAPVVPEVSRLAAPPAAAEPLDPSEIAEMKEHLAYLRTYKDLLRLRLNAAEDLLVNGRREPTDRGVCRHLLGKVDRTVIEHAIAREPLSSDAAARARMLTGAIRLTADVGVLLTYLETLAHVRSRTEAAQAFAEVVRRIAFESLSAVRLARLLQVLVETFVDHERVQVLFSLLDQAEFRRAFDAAAPSLPPEIAAVFAPLRAVHRRLHGEDTGDESPATLATGVEQVLSAPDPLLRAYAEPLRVRMLELTLRPGVSAALADRAAGVLLSSLDRPTRTYARLAMRRTAQLLARHADDRARSTLEELTRAQPGFRLPARWLHALGARRLGRVALDADAGEGRLLRGLWLDGQRPVWVRTAPAADAERLAREADLQGALALPGIPPVVEHGVASGVAYVAVAAQGHALGAVDPRVALAVAAGAARVLHALALAGAVLPDAAPARLLISQGDTVLLADLDGATRAEPAVASAAHAAAVIILARALDVARVLPLLPPDVADAVGRALDAAAALPELVGVLDRAALVAEHP
jgi:hypothetical protein